MDVCGNLKPPAFGIFGGRNLFPSDSEYQAVFKPRRSWAISVEGFDTCLPEDEIKEALFNHFQSCGVIARVFLTRNPETNVVDSLASIAMTGDDSDEKALELNGSEVGGRKIVVKAAPWPKPKLKDVPFGSCVPGCT